MFKPSTAFLLLNLTLSSTIFAAQMSKHSMHENYFNQSIDHHNTAIGTFKQRYYIDNTYSAGDHAPVFLYICGEYSCPKEHVLNRGGVEALVKRFHGKLVVLEHRYYGKSLPTLDFSTKNLQYLSTQAALDDLANFQQWVTKKNRWTGKWIAIGASYPGSLAAYYRLKFPHLVAGAWASSAPVMAREKFQEYDAHVSHVLPLECANRVREVVSLAESVLDNEVQLHALKTKLNASNIENKYDFLVLLAEIVASAVQGKEHVEFCRAVITANNALDGFINGAQYLYKKQNLIPVSLTPQTSVSIDPVFYEKDPSAGPRQWFYQSCTEYGYWQVANEDHIYSTRSHFINMHYHHQLCERLFGKRFTTNINYINKTFYQPLLDHTTSNIFFTNGANDPWSKLSLTAENHNTTNPNLTYYMIKNGAHHDDTNTPHPDDSESVKEARAILVALVEKWLAE